MARATAQPLHALGDPPKAPSHLSGERQAVWDEIVSEYRLYPENLQVLELALTALDRAAAARDEVERDGLTVEGRFGLKLHPAVQAEKDSSALAGRLLRQLELEEPRAPVDRLALRSRGQY
jgi:phage terminase small subunit